MTITEGDLVRDLEVEIERDQNPPISTDEADESLDRLDDAQVMTATRGARHDHLAGVPTILVTDLTTGLILLHDQVDVTTETGLIHEIDLAIVVHLTNVNLLVVFCVVETTTCQTVLKIKVRNATLRSIFIKER